MWIKYLLQGRWVYLQAMRFYKNLFYININSPLLESSYKWPMLKTCSFINYPVILLKINYTSDATLCSVPCEIIGSIVNVCPGFMIPIALFSAKENNNNDNVDGSYDDNWKQ